MVSSKLFYHIHKRLNEIFSPGQDVSLGGKSVLVCGDLAKLPPVCAKSVFTFNDTETMEGFISMDSWRKFRLAELDQVMHRDDEMFVNLLNKIRVDEIDQKVEDVVKLRFIGRCYPGKILHISAENALFKRHNGNNLKHIPG